MSLGGGFSTAMNNAVAAAVNAGVVVVVAAGNSNTNACTASPASEDLVITVGSTTSSDLRSSFSNYGDCVDVYNPGSSITSAWKGSNTDIKTISGTSMASPHVAGIAVGLVSADPDLSPAEVSEHLKNTAKTINTTPDGPVPPAPTPPPTPCQLANVEVKIKTDNYPGETTWKLTDTCTNNEVLSGSGYSQKNTLYTEVGCLANAKFTFKIEDSYGDGICCNYGQGSYEVKVNNVQKASGGNFGSQESQTFGDCAPPTPPPVPAPTPPPVPAPTPPPVPVPTPPPVTVSPAPSS